MAPGSRVQKNTAEELHRLQDELKKKEARIARLEREKEAALAGRLGDPLAMCLKTGWSSKSRTSLSPSTLLLTSWQRIVKDQANQHLEVGKTISGQNKKRLESTLVLIAKVAPFFACFEGFWPAHDMIAGYLLNAQTRRRRDSRLEKEAEASNSDNAAEDDGLAESDTAENNEDDLDAGEDDADAVENDQGGDLDDDDMSFPPSVRKVSFRIESDEDSGDEGGPSQNTKPRGTKDGAKGANAKTKTTGKHKAKQPVEEPLPKKSKSDKENKTTAKRKATEHIEQPPPKQPAKTNKSKTKQSDPECDSPGPNLASKKRPLSLLTWNDLPALCPTVLCEDELPEVENQKILSLFQQRIRLVQEVGPRGRGVSFLDLQICAAIMQENKRVQYVALGEQNQWPESINFTNVRNRILGFCDRLLLMVQNPSILKESSVWNNFLTCINYRLSQFARSSSAQKMKSYRTLYAGRCGYYGPRGEFIINSTLTRLLAMDSYKTDLLETVHELVVDDIDLFDFDGDYDETANLIPLDDFISFVLAPFVAALLISDDRKITLEEAHHVREKHSSFGDVMQPGDDEASEASAEIDQLHQENICALKGTTNELSSQPPRFRNKVTNPLESPKTELLGCQNSNRPRPRLIPYVKSTDLPLPFLTSPTQNNSKPTPASTKAKSTISIADFKEKAKKALKKTEEGPKPEAKPNLVNSNYGTRSKSRPVLVSTLNELSVTCCEHIILKAPERPYNAFQLYF
ncbi:hypothetical protein B0H19DRAFT_1059771 [Mycena capillaripes]|nr:hypothetical protein B0H19DRAFT_1059771 [Mycena capillaripes]